MLSIPFCYMMSFSNAKRSQSTFNLKRKEILMNHGSNKQEQVTKTAQLNDTNAKPSSHTTMAKPQKKANPQSTNRPQRRQRKKPTKPVWDLATFEVPEEEGQTRFHDLDLPDELMHGIYDLSFRYCSPIQAKILPYTLQGLDAIGKAQTGTGKTAAFLIAVIDDLLRNPIEDEIYLSEPRALIIAPTRELVMQIASDAKALCKYTQLHVSTIFGGMDYQKQRQHLNKKAADIVVATPGRLLDFMTRRHIYLDMVETLVLDEADRMLDMGFIPQVKRIVKATPDVKHRQTQLFSATFTQDIIELASQWTCDPVQVDIEPERIAAAQIDQKVYLVSNEEKLRVLLNILRQPEVSRVIIFTNRRDQSQHLYEKIQKKGFSVGILSGEIAQNKRTRTLDNFKNSKLQVIVATDVMGRGIHIDGISHVINYNLPEDPEDYVHRIGRTGRAGENGIAISLACENESFQLPAIGELLGKKLNCELPPEALLLDSD